MTLATLRRMHLAASVVVLAGWAIWFVQRVRGDVGVDSVWFGALLVAGLVVTAGRVLLDRAERVA